MSSSLLLELGCLLAALMSIPGVGRIGAWVVDKRFALTEMPQRVLVFSGLAGGCAAALSAKALVDAATTAATAVTLVDMDHAARAFGFSKALLALIGLAVGAGSLLGSLIVFAKRRGRMSAALRFPGQQIIDGVLLATAFALGLMVIYQLDTRLILGYSAVCAWLSASRSLRIAKADHALVDPLLSAVAGLAVAGAGYALPNPALLAAGTLVCAVGARSARSMSRSIAQAVSNA